jgi:hypothetical protein
MAKKKATARAKKLPGPPRTNIPATTRELVLLRCRRHCCMGFFLRGIREPTDGQIAHLDRDRTNADLDSLVFLCLACHALYDTKGNRVQGYTPGEVRYYRHQLQRVLRFDDVEWTITIRADRTEYDKVTGAKAR